MKRHRYKVSFFITTLLYLLPVLLYLYLFKQAFVSVQTPKEKVIELSLSQFAPQAPQTDTAEPVQPEQLVEEEPESEPEKEPEVVKELELEPEPEPEPNKTPPEKKPEPIVKETPVPEPLSKTVKKRPQKPIKKHTKHPPKKTHKKRHRLHKKRQVSGGGSPRHSAAQSNAFLAKIRARINRAKSYPRIAQRRGMQGVVKIRFTILANGHVGNISLSGPKLFYSSARKAIRSAFPVNVKHTPISLPLTVKLSLRYKLH